MKVYTKILYNKTERKDKQESTSYPNLTVRSLMAFLAVQSVVQTSFVLRSLLPSPYMEGRLSVCKRLGRTYQVCCEDEHGVTGLNQGPSEDRSSFRFLKIVLYNGGIYFRPKIMVLFFLFSSITHSSSHRRCKEQVFYLYYNYGLNTLTTLISSYITSIYRIVSRSHL